MLKKTYLLFQKDSQYPNYNPELQAPASKSGRSLWWGTPTPPMHTHPHSLTHSQQAAEFAGGFSAGQGVGR